MPTPIENIFRGIETILFCDESKFYLNNGDFENAIYYFAVSVEKRAVSKVHDEFDALLKKHRVKSRVYHSSVVFKESRPREELMNDITTIIIQNRLQCFCYKYSKDLLFEPTKLLSKFNNDLLNFDQTEFQALFYFLTILNTYVRDFAPSLLKKDISMYFDRNVYGIEEVESFNFPNETFVLKQMTFTEKSKISLLCLPDYLGYIFRKSKQSQNKFQHGDKKIETSKLVINSWKCLTQISAAKLFHFINMDDKIINKALLTLTE